MAESSAGQNITITYVTEYGTTPSQLTILNSKRLTSTELPTLAFSGMTHKGWYTTSTFEEDTKVEVGDTLASSTTLYAKWAYNYVIVNAQHLYDIADSIREALNTSVGYSVDEMASAISSIKD